MTEKEFIEALKAREKFLKKFRRKPRKRWWQENDARLFIEKMSDKWRQIREKNWELARQFYKLPDDFFCWHVNRSSDYTFTDWMHRAIIIARARPRGSFEYDLLEIDRLVWKRMSRILRAEKIAQKFEKLREEMVL